MRRFCLFLILVLPLVFAISPQAAADDGQTPQAASNSLEISHAWVVGSTPLLIDLLANMYGQEVIPENILPLPWQEFMENGETRWCGATLTDGEKSYQWLAFPWNSGKRLSYSDQEKLAQKVADHPLGKHFFPEGHVMVVFSPTTTMVSLVPDDMPSHFLLGKEAESKLLTTWSWLAAQCYVGLHVDGSKIPLSERVPSEGEKYYDSITTFGLHFEGNEYEKWTLFMRDTTPENTPSGKNRKAYIDSDVSFRLMGFLDEGSPIRVSHRFMPEDAGAYLIHMTGGAYVIPPDCPFRRHLLFMGTNTTLFFRIP